MATSARKTAPLGELIVAAFDEAARYSSDPRLVARLATSAVLELIRHTHGDIASEAAQSRDELKGCVA